MKRDPTVSTDASGMLKVGTKQTDPSCEANRELKLRSAWQRRNLAMDLAGLATFDIVEGWVQYLFQQLLKEQPRGFSKISLQQILDCDKHLFVVAAHETMGKLSSGPDEDKPLDAVIEKLRESNEVLQYLTPLPASRHHEAPQPSTPRPAKVQKGDKGNKGTGKGTPAAGKAQERRNCLTAASLTTLTTNRCVLPIRMGVASSRALRERDVLADIISLTRAVASGTRRITCATTLTEFRARSFTSASIKFTTFC